MKKEIQQLMMLCLGILALALMSSCSESNNAVVPNLPDKNVTTVLNDVCTEWDAWKFEVENKMEDYNKVKEGDNYQMYADSKGTCFILYMFPDGNRLATSTVAVPRQEEISIEGIKKLRFIGNLENCDVFGVNSGSYSTMGVIYQPAGNKKHTIISFAPADGDYDLTRSGTEDRDATPAAPEDTIE